MKGQQKKPQTEWRHAEWIIMRIDHDNEGGVGGEANVASISATLSQPWGMVLSKYML